MATGSPVTVNCTAPQKQLPLMGFPSFIFNLLEKVQLEANYYAEHMIPVSGK
jgi:hypothetical protein